MRVISRNNPVFPANRTMPSARSAVVGPVRTPLTPSVTNSLVPLIAGATTGNPTVRASSAAIPKASRRAGATYRSLLR